VKRAIQGLAGAGAIIGVVGGAWMIDDRYASAGDLEKVVQSVEALTIRIERGFIEDKLDSWTRRKVDMEIRLGFNCRDCDIDQRAIFAQIVSEIGSLYLELQ
jgi:hypothetical protein